MGRHRLGSPERDGARGTTKTRPDTSATISQWPAAGRGSGAQVRVFEQMARLVIDLEWPLIIEQVQIESLGRHLTSVLHKSTVNHRRFGPILAEASRSWMLPRTSEHESKSVCQMCLAALREGGPPLCRSVTCTYGAPSGTRTPNPLIRTTHLSTVVASCGNHCATTRSGDSHHWTSVDSCRCLSSKDVAKSVCDGDQTLPATGTWESVSRLGVAQRHWR